MLRRYISYFTSLFLILLAFYFLVNIFKENKPQATPTDTPKETLGVQKKVEEKVEDIVQTVTLPLKGESKLDEVTSKALKGTKGKYAVVIKNLKSGEEFFLNEHRSFEAGSLYKVWILAAAYKQIEEGKIKEDQVLSQDIETLNKKFKIASESAEQKEGRITLSVKSAMKQMITISHNYAALLVTEKVRVSNVGNFLKDNGFAESAVGEPPKTTAYDIAVFFEKLYKGELASEENTQIMVDLLKGQKLNNKLPKYLPKEVEIAHKTGELGWFSHDAGIVFSEKGDYIIVVLSESNSPKGAEERIALLSKAVYEYFENK